MRFELTTPGLRDQCSATELKRLFGHTAVFRRHHQAGSVAEWSKALVLGTSPKGRGFESHRCQNNFFSLSFFSYTKGIIRSRQDSNLRGETPLDFKSNALTTRPRLQSSRHPAVEIKDKCVFFSFTNRHVTTKLFSSPINWPERDKRLRGATVARLTPDQKAACSNHVGVNWQQFFCIPISHKQL